MRMLKRREMGKKSQRALSLALTLPPLPQKPLQRPPLVLMLMLLLPQWLMYVVWCDVVWMWCGCVWVRVGHCPRASSSCCQLMWCDVVWMWCDVDV